MSDSSPASQSTVSVAPREVADAETAEMAEVRELWERTLVEAESLPDGI